MRVWAAFTLLLTLTVVATDWVKKTSRRSHLLLRPHLLYSCDRPDNAVNITWSNFVYSGTRYYFNNKFTLSRGAKTISQCIVEVTRCSEAITTNTCEYFQTWRFRQGICSFLFDPRFYTAIYFRHIHPAFRCPIKQGNYETVNASVDVSLLEHLPVKAEGNIWKIRVQLFDENEEMLTCVVVHLDFLRTRS